jgi:hypothetical protein
MSGKTIYNYVFFHMKGELKKPALKDLRLRGKARKKGKEGENTGNDPDRHPSGGDKRPECIRIPGRTTSRRSW